MRIKRKEVYTGIISIPEGKSGNFEIRHIHRPAGYTTSTGNMRMAIHGQRIKQVKFDEPTVWHELLEDGGTWMTDYPCEQYQHDEALVGAHGDVLVGGLGLGYAVAVLSRKPHVRSVVVVEKSADVIKLVEPSLRRYGAKRWPVLVVHADLFDFLKHDSRKFDVGFYDIWQGDGETTFHQMVIPLRQLSRGKVRDVRCWNENIMRAQLNHGIWGRLRLLENDVFKSQVDLDVLAVGDCDSQNVWLNWSVPYWRWYRDTRPSITRAEKAGALYTQWYGLWDNSDKLMETIAALVTG